MSASFPLSESYFQTVRRTRLEDLTILEGGLTLEYYPHSNCGLISYFLVRGFGESSTHVAPVTLPHAAGGNVATSAIPSFTMKKLSTYGCGLISPGISIINAEPRRS
jgi:hypothetical protein